MADDRVVEFVRALAELDRGDLSKLRRNAGETMGSSRGVSGLFYRIAPGGVPGSWDEEIFFLVATLYGLNKYKHIGDFGTTMARVKAVHGSKSVDQRMAVLLDSEFGYIDEWRRGGGELAYRLRQLIKLAAGHEVGVDWPLLIEHLCQWTHPKRWVRKAWAQSYYAGAVQLQEQAEAKREGA